MFLRSPLQDHLKKGSKQATLSSFFSPQKPADRAAEIEAEAAEVEAKSSTKRPRAASADSKEKKQEEEEKEVAKPQSKKKNSIAKAKGKSEAPAKPRAKAKAKKRKKKEEEEDEAPRFISPHAMLPGDDEDEDEFDDEEDVFNTPEAKRARAELEVDQSVALAAQATGEIEAKEVDVTEDKTSAEDVVDLMGVKASEEAKPAVNSAVKKARSKKTATVPAKVTTKTPTKRQQKMKEKAAVVEEKPAPVEPLDPATQVLVDTYKMKTDELTRQHMELLQSKDEDDAIMQDIFGVALDCDLDVIVDHEKAHQALVKTWQTLQEQSQTASNSAETAIVPATAEFPYEVKCLIVKGIQGRTSSLSVLSNDLLASFKKDIDWGDVDMESDLNAEHPDSLDTVDRSAALVVEMEIKMLAQRTPHGVRHAKADVFEDTSADALWVWEVGNLDKYFGEEAQKTVKRMRKHRRRLGQQLKTLARVLHLLHQKPVDKAKLSAEEAKVGKFGLVVDDELQKAKERKHKEQEKQEKQHAAEEKKRHDQEAKNEEKRKREHEAEEEKTKRQKVWGSFLRTSNNGGTDTAAANVASSSESAVDVTGDQESEDAMARIDAAIGFLSDATSSSISAVEISQQSIFSSLKGKQNSIKKQTDKLPADGWSARRYRDPKLGVMKLLQFHENTRPAYCGTFSKRSRIFHGGRRPLSQYAKFDYSVDSDDEWEEEEPGESLSDADSDGDESDEDNLDYGDQWLAYEDEVDYMDDAQEEDDRMEHREGASSPTKHKLPSQLQKKRAKVKGMKPAKLESQITGPYWCTCSDTCTDDHFPGRAGELLCEPAFESTLMRKAREYEQEQKRLQAVKEEQQKQKQEQQKLKEQQQQQHKQHAQEQKKAAAADAKASIEKTTPQKSTPQKTTPQKSQKPAAKQPVSTSITGHVKSTPTKQAAPVSTTPSPAKPTKPTKPIDAWFKKIPLPAPSTSVAQPQQQDEQENAEKADVEVITVD
ncbi:hypothetical protein BBO99_00003602 [Phytophthora kernoviae]|uniref:Chromatin assembly factor 1 subunit A dimerization domain-containing protein n=1 Tax=Phytophthora kernoviae TaxID=325452 RepID=A0A3R7H763_9STRA|nr:hypothetical protein BBI17_003725 [Phytophthora kernoviae]RLN81583.1 hypothetical protein BBO99_00003602 [Phytophthora kernoviae]